MIINRNGIDIELTTGEEAEFEASRPTVVLTVPQSVSARQFELQLLQTGLLDQVEAWVNAQPKAVQIAYLRSGDFVRSEPMMAAGFKAMGFADEEIDVFFTAASKL